MNQRTLVSKKDVSSSEPTKNEKYVLVKSKSGKVTYMVANQNTHIFDYPRYSNIFNELDKIENCLEKPLNFNVKIDFITMDAISSSFTNSEITHIFNIIGNRIFELLNDISSKKSLYDSEFIANTYFSDKTLKELKEYYDNNHEFVLKSFEKGYSTLPVFTVLQTNSSSIMLDKIYSTIRDENSSSFKRDLAFNLVAESDNVLHLTTSDRAKEDYYYHLLIVNKFFNELTEKDVNSLSNITIDSLYNFISEKYFKI
jgi:hypothetical protein